MFVCFNWVGSNRVQTYSIVSIKRTVFFSTVTVGKNMVCLIGTIEYALIISAIGRVLTVQLYIYCA